MKLEGVIYCGENLEWMRQFPDEFVDLCYIDPPFFSNRRYEVIFNDGEEIRSFHDRWKGGIEHYIEWMRDRVFEIHRILKRTGSFYLHCDYHAGHYLKVMCDDIFGRKNFRNELAWCYKGRELSQKHWNQKHDNIFFYTKGSKWTFNWKEVAEEPTPQVLAQYKHVDERGERYVIRTRSGSKGLTKEGPNTYRQYIRTCIPPRSWVEINFVSSSGERQRYPTQKPEALLERIIRASSNPGDLVFDPFCGCGTTLVVAQHFKRRWLGIDVSPTACKLMKRRLAKQGAPNVEIIGIQYEREELKKLKPFEFQNWVIGVMSGTVSDRKSHDMGIDGYSFMERDPIQAKQEENVGRPHIDKFETAIRRVGKQRGYMVAFSFTKGAYDEVARVKRENGLEIELLTVEQLVQNYGK